MKTSNNKGSAYLFVIISLTITMLFMLHSLKKSRQATVVSYNLQDQLNIENAHSACKTFMFHKIKTWPMHKREFTLKNEQLSFGKQTCSIIPIQENSRQLSFSFTLKISSVKSKKSSKKSFLVYGKRKRVNRRRMSIHWLIEDYEEDAFSYDF
ncbi:MAG: hypothetical protein COB02_15375 [Candidatus Cloacimonadota bacterium]|nr:MAG: hypothetical protein COB02_15375 [Candidatus Cloacimonadota bacterium]